MKTRKAEDDSIFHCLRLTVVSQAYSSLTTHTKTVFTKVNDKLDKNIKKRFNGLKKFVFSLFLSRYIITLMITEPALFIYPRFQKQPYTICTSTCKYHGRFFCGKRHSMKNSIIDRIIIKTNLGRFAYS